MLKKQSSAAMRSISNQQLLAIVVRQVSEAGTINDSKLQMTVAAELEKLGYAKHALAAKLANVLKDKQFARGSEGQIQLQNR